MSSLRIGLPQANDPSGLSDPVDRRINTQSSQYIVLTVNTGSRKASEAQEVVRAWLTQCLATFEPRPTVDDYKTESYRDEGEVCCFVDAIEDEGDVPDSNQLIFGIFMFPDSIQSWEIYKDGLVAEERPGTPVSPGHFMSWLKTPPSFVSKLGVSGVNRKTFVNIWDEIIRIDRNHFPGEGQGYMIHPMTVVFSKGSVETIRETSFNFGWEKYRIGLHE